MSATSHLASPVPGIEAQEFLKRLPLLADLSPDEIERVAASTTPLRLARGSVIFRRGDPCRGFHTVVYGSVKLSFISQGGDEKVIELLGPGQSFGEALMFMDKAYIVQAETVADSLLLHIRKEAILPGLVNPGFARRMLAGMSRRLHEMVCDAEANALRSGGQRIVGYLLKDDPPEGGRVTLSFSKKTIASRLNLTPEYFSRVLHDMAGQGLLSIDGRDIAILDIDGLRAYGV